MILLLIFIMMLMFAPWILGLVGVMFLAIFGLSLAVMTSPIFWLIIMFLALISLIFH